MDNVQKEALYRVYQNSVYSLETPTMICEVKPTAISEQFKFFIRNNRIQSWGLITSDNPMAVRQMEEVNDMNRELMAQDLSDYYTCRCVGMDIETKSHHEVGFFVANISAAEIIRLGKKYNQNAVLIGDDEAKVDVVWLADQ